MRHQGVQDNPRETWASALSVEWEVVGDAGDSAWDECRCLYAYSNPEDGELLYIGMAGNCSMRQRLASHRNGSLGTWLRSEGFTEIDVRIGRFADCKRLTMELLSDIESLAIRRIRPRGNIRNMLSLSYNRPGQRVRFEGEWPWKSHFIDRR